MSHHIRIETTGQTFVINPGETIIQGAQRQGISLPYGCQNGQCGSCIGTLVEGKVTYPDGEPEALAASSGDRHTAVFCQAVPESDLTIRIRIAESIDAPPVAEIPCRAQNLERLSHDVMRVLLKIPESESFIFLAGQYIEFILKDGRHRAFSIANAPHNNEFLELHIRYISGGSFTGHVFDDMRDKEMLRMQGPLGSFYLRENSDRPIIMMGGGTGFAPLKGMLEHMFHAGITRPVHLFWGARSKQDLYLHDLPLKWQEEHDHFKYTPVLSHPFPEDQWTAEASLVTDAVVATYSDLSSYDIYMSGAPAMIDAATPLFVNHQADLNSMYSDAFEFAKDVLDKLAAKG